MGELRQENISLETFEQLAPAIAESETKAASLVDIYRRYLDGRSNRFDGNDAARIWPRHAECATQSSLVRTDDTIFRNAVFSVGKSNFCERRCSEKINKSSTIHNDEYLLVLQ